LVRCKGHIAVVLRVVDVVVLLVIAGTSKETPY
jgi:hypothetical protein